MRLLRIRKPLIHCGRLFETHSEFRLYGVVLYKCGPGLCRSVS